MRPEPTKLYSIVVIHIEKLYGAAADRCQSGDQIALPNKMLVPALSAGMKQWDEMAVHMGGQIRPLVKITPVASEAEI